MTPDEMLEALNLALRLKEATRRGLVRAEEELTTTRERDESTLRKSELMLNRAQSVAHIGSWELDLTKNLLHWSTETFRIFRGGKRAAAGL